jgi:N-alpha-acetyltransferase 30
MPQVVLETEYDNLAALSLYESLGFIREKRLYRFYLNGKDAFRLVLAVPPPPNAYGDRHVVYPLDIPMSGRGPTPLPPYTLDFSSTSRLYNVLLQR